MNTRPIKGHTNLETLLSVASNIGGMDEKGLEEQLKWIQNGITAAKAKITRAQEKRKAAKYILRRRNQYPEYVIKQAKLNYMNAEQDEFDAFLEKAQMVERYRNFRSLLYIQRSLKLIVENQ